MLTFSVSLGSLAFHHHGRPSSMLRVGSLCGQLAGSSPVPPGDVAPETAGFDGQFFLFLALDPLVAAPTQRALDAPRVRARRIGLPLIGAALGATGPGPAWGLLIAEALAVLGLIAVVQSGAWRSGLPPLWCLAVPLCLPFTLSLELVTSELPAAFFVVAAAEAHRRGRDPLAVLSLAAACLTKEVALAAPLAFAAWELVRDRARRAPVWLSACLPFLAWEGYLLARIPGGGGSSLFTNLALPGEGAVRALSSHVAALSSGDTDPKAAACSWRPAGTSQAQSVPSSSVP